jgi:hypothetical protein
VQVRTRRRRVSPDGCGSAGGGDRWLRTCWHEDEDASAFVGNVSRQRYTPSHGFFNFDWPLGFPPVPQGLLLQRWLVLMQDGWLSDRTLDIEISLILLNTNLNLVCMATLLWDLDLSGAITPTLTVFAVPLSLKPTEQALRSRWWLIPLRLGVLVLLVVNWHHLYATSIMLGSSLG